MIRRIIEIDKEKCNGCGLCAKACHEGAIGMVDGKATLLRDDYCDGLGDCLPVCPTGAITFVEREAAAYDEGAVQANMAKKGKTPCACPGSQSKLLEVQEKMAAKREEEVFKPHESRPYILKKGSYSLRLIQLVRDEAHRFAITFNRQLRAKGMFKGGLESIEGVGPATRRALLSKFRTIENIKNAPLSEIESIKGMSKHTAKNIYEHFNKKN